MDAVTQTRPAASEGPDQDSGDRGWAAMRGWAVGSLAGNMGLIITGALVRLTKSGLGCPTWPKCTDESLIPQGMGLHGVIEFGNRTLTFVLVALAIGAFVSAMRLRDRGQPRSDLRKLSFWAAMGVPLQAVIGGITVLTQLNPFVVASHLLVSVAMIVILVQLVRLSFRREVRAVPPTGYALTVATFAVTMAAMVLGTMVTGAAPHSGDANVVERNGLLLEAVAKAHAWVVWVLLVLLALTIWKTRTRQAVWLAVATLAQGLVGYLQYFNGLPVWIIMLHMIGVSVIAALSANMLFSVRRVSLR